MLNGKVLDTTGTPRKGVIVSNGRECVLTDADGVFSLPDVNSEREGRRFAMITPPAGFRAVGPGGWFRDLVISPRAGLTFTIEPDPARAGNSFTFAQVTDLHIGAYDADWLVEDLEAIASGAGNDDDHPPVQCIIATGDVTQGGKPHEYEAYLAAMRTSRLPVIHAPGNHDWIADRSGQTWSDRIGPLYFSLDWGPAHLVAYESTAHRYNEAMPVNEWCAADLALVPSEKPVVMLIHDQFDEGFYRQWRSHRIVASLSGHWHSSRIYHDGGAVHINQPTTLMGGIDYSARGYTVVTVRSDGSVAFFRRLLGAGGRARRTGVAAVADAPRNPTEHSAPEVRLGSSWSQFKGGPLRNGVSADALSLPFVRTWQTRLPGGLLFGSPVIAGDAAYIAVLDEEHADGGALVALDAATGAIRWQNPTGASVKHAPAVWDNLVIVVTVSGNVQAFYRQTGDAVWTYQLGDPSKRWMYSTPLVADGRVYTGHAAHFVALDAASGERLWLRDDLQQSKRDDWISSYASPAADDRNVYVGFFWHAEPTWALDLLTGETRWVVVGERNDWGPANTPALDGAGHIYVVSHDAVVRAYDTATGEAWREYDLERVPGVRGGRGWSGGSPALAADVLYIPVGDGAVRAVEVTTGVERWRWASDEAVAGVQAYARGGASVLSTPVVAGNVLIVGASDGRIVALDRANGAVLWSDDLEAPVVSSPALSGNLLVCGAGDGWLYAWTA